MQSYDEALARILGAVSSPLAAEPVALADALGRALAGDIFADSDLPPFDNSAVDGFAVRLKTTGAASPDTPLTLPIGMEIPAGGWPQRPLRAGEVAAIFTGAPLPEGADALVMVEDTEPADDGWVTLRHGGSPQFIRRAGSDLRRGDLAIPAGTTIGPGEIGLLASLNHAQIACPRRPRVALLTTGDEIVPVGERALAPGQIRDSNGPAIAAAIEAAGAQLARRVHAADTPEAVSRALEEVSGCDLILSTGGVSVGEHDHVKAVVEAKGALDFWRIAIKPGKPLAFGRIDDTLFIGLPGNPVSSLVTFELFVRPPLRKLAGHAQVMRPTISATLTATLPHAPGRREFVRARLSRENGLCQATPTGAQGSHRLHSMVGVDALLVAHEDRGDYAAGETLPAILLRES